MIRLKELRIKAGYTQAETAQLLGISQPAYANYERGARQADYDTLSKLAEIFNSSVDYLLGRNAVYSFPSEDITYMEVIGSVKRALTGLPVRSIRGI